MSSSMPLYATAVVPASAAAQVGSTGTRRLIAVVLFGGSANSQVEFKNAATDTGNVLLSVNALANTTAYIDMSEFGGISFSTAIYCKPAGTGAIAYVWYE